MTLAATKADNLATSHLARIDEHLWVFGGEWDTPTGRVNLFRVARDTAKRRSAKFYLVRKHGLQFCIIRGVADAQQPTRAYPWRSAAAGLISQYSGSFIAAVDISPSKFSPVWWVVAGRKNQILVGGDCIFRSEKEAKDYFETVRKQETEWRKIFAPGDWNVPGAVTLSSRDLFAKADSPRFHDATRMEISLVSAIRTIQNLNFKMALYGLGVAAALYYIGHTVQRRWFPKPDAKPVALELPKGAPIDLALKSCIAAIEANFGKTVSIVGWDLTELTCQDGQLIAEVSADDGVPAGSLKQQAPDAVLDPGAGKKGHLFFQTAPVAQPIHPSNSHTVLAQLQDLADRLGTTVTPSPPTALAAGFVRGTQTVWTISTEAPDMLWQESLSRLPATIMTYAKLTVRGGSNNKTGDDLTWTISGISYEN